MQFAQMDELEKTEDVHRGCTILPFTTIFIGGMPVSIRYTIKDLLTIEQLLCIPLWRVIDLFVLNMLSDTEKRLILQYGIVGNPKEALSLLDDEPDERRVFQTAGLELIRAIGMEVIYDDHGNPVDVRPPEVDTYKHAEISELNSPVKDHEKVEFETFGQWYEDRLRELFKTGLTRIDEFLELMPVEIEVYIDAHVARNIYDRQLNVALAYDIGAMMGAKPKQSLASVLKQIEFKAIHTMGSKFTRDKAKKEATKRVTQTQRERASVDALVKNMPPPPGFQGPQANQSESR